MALDISGLETEVQERLTLMLQDLGEEAFGQELHTWLRAMLRENGYATRRCPHCGTRHLERELPGGPTGRWVCPDCTHPAALHEWRES